MQKYPEKFVSEEKIFKNIHRGDRIFISTGCGEPQYLVSSLIEYVKSNPKAFTDAEVFHIWTLGVAPYADEKFSYNFRHNSFFIGNNTREAVNRGAADYTPIFLSEIPDLLNRKIVPVDVSLIQASTPDRHGFISLGVSVDIAKAAVQNSSVVIAQINSNMPRVHGDGFVHIKDIDYLVPYDEPLLEYEDDAPDDIAQGIGDYVSRIIGDGDTIQVGYGSIPNAILKSLDKKNNLGVHTELLTEGIVDLMKKGVIDNSKKSINRGKATATFCMGKKETYSYIHDNPSVEFRSVDYTNNPLIISQHRNMVAVNSALEIDLTGQASAESIGFSNIDESSDDSDKDSLDVNGSKREQRKVNFYSGIGGQADFMRGAVLAPGGRTILTLQSTARDGKISRIVPFLHEGAGVTLNRGDIHYVVTEFGIAYLHGKNIRERAMELIAIAHPDFRGWLIDEAKKLNLIYRDQAYIPGKKGEYPEHLEAYRTTKSGFTLFFRPVKISDEPLLKDFFYSLSDQSLYRRFFHIKQRMPHKQLQEMSVTDYTRNTVVVAVIPREEKEILVGVGQYQLYGPDLKAEAAIAVRDDYQNRGIGTELLSYLTYLAKRQGLMSFTADVLVENQPMLHLFEKVGFDVEKRNEEGVYEMTLNFRK